MARTLKSDKVLFITTLVLVCVGVVMVFSASAAITREKRLDDYHFVIRQAVWAVLGIAVLAAAMRVDYRRYRNDVFIWGLLGAVTVALVVVLSGTEVKEVNGAKRWLNLGPLGIQPSELAKLACVLFAAMMLERRAHRINEIKYSLLPIGLVVGGLAALIYPEPDFGTAMSLVMIAGVMAFAAGLSYKHMIGGALIIVPVLVLMMLSKDYRVDRWTSFFDPWADPQGDGYQAVQSQVAVGSGGVLGRGLNEGRQKLLFLPEPHTDFIYSVIGEEFGLVGSTAVLACFGIIIWRGLRIAVRAEDAFGSLVALGVTTMVGAQALVNISVALSLLPTKGISLPLVSSGGSSLLVSLAGIGILLNISQHETAG